MSNTKTDYIISSSEVNYEMFKIIYQISKIRTYNAAGVFKGVVIKDKEKAHELIHLARSFISSVENGYYDSKRQ